MTTAEIDTRPRGYRIGAGLIALVAWTGLASQFVASNATSSGVGEALWEMLRYFTILANLALAVLLSAVALGRGVPAGVAAAATLSILLVGIVFALLLRGLVPLAGAALLADWLLHHVTPFATPLWWLVFTREGRIDAAAPWRWLAIPVGYFLYALGRAAIDGRYPYPFMNVDARGWGAVLLTGLAMGVAFVAAGHAMRWLDARRNRGSVAA